LIPLRDNNPTRRFPLICALLIAANVVVYVLDHVVFGQQVVQHVVYRGELREIVRQSGGLSDQYAMVPADVTARIPGAVQTVFTSMFLHAGMLHIGMNMLYLWVFGNNIEDVLGRPRFLIFYLACGFAAAALHIAMGPQSGTPTVGASGAVAGLMGAYLILFPGAEILSIVPVFFISTLMDVPAVMVIGFWALLQFMNASWLGGGELRGGGVAYFAHIGGFVAGIILIALLGGRKLVDRRPASVIEDRYYRR
jgi:membrane associated rhomboid family serine protease